MQTDRCTQDLLLEWRCFPTASSCFCSDHPGQSSTGWFAHFVDRCFHKYNWILMHDFLLLLVLSHSFLKQKYMVKGCISLRGVIDSELPPPCGSSWPFWLSWCWFSYLELGTHPGVWGSVEDRSLYPDVWEKSWSRNLGRAEGTEQSDHLIVYPFCDTTT